MTAPLTAGWSRLWAFGAPHYLRLPGTMTLCGLPTDGTKLTLLAEPDSDQRPSDRKICKHCEKKLAAERKAGR
ncbi:hypothetical protein [uncultured Deinococcus sp.]|uniref:hypothetical protein n=1 Tax=uncultured Deinococcus sp. TaxID=158789 RepID=UPI0025E6FC43|nr:hypothetical protein [uncultured Deinococcus sp.]